MLQRSVLRSALFVLLSGCAAATKVFAAEPAEVRPARIIHCEAIDDHRATVVTGVAITRDGRTIAAATDDHCVFVWDAASGELKEHLHGHDDWVHSVILSPDGATLASGGSDRMLSLWNVAAQKRVLQIPACTNRVSAVCLHPNNQQLAVVGFSNKLQIINSSTGQTTQELDCPCSDVRTIAFSPNGERMAAAGRCGMIRIWNVADGSSQKDIETDHRRIQSLAFSPDGRWLAAAGDSQKIRIFDTVSGNVAKTLDTRPAKVYSLLFLDNRHLATGGTDNHITIWDLDTQRATSQLVGHTGTVAALACDGTGAVLVSGSYDTTLCIWNLVDKQIPATARRAPGSRFSPAAGSPAGDSR
jgi:WD40 repeat protein